MAPPLSVAHDFGQKLIGDAPHALAEYAGRHLTGNENYRWNVAGANFVLRNPSATALGNAELKAVAGGVLPGSIALGIGIGQALHALECDEH